jgi:site-specific recombinase XerD
MNQDIPIIQIQVPMQKIQQSRYVPTPRALSAQAVQKLKETMLAWVQDAQGDSSQLVWSHRDCAMVQLILYAGVTMDELCELNTEDVINCGIGQRRSISGMLGRPSHEPIAMYTRG